ncbi:FAD/NAD(P)-binding domain-containing protein [Viridothelium virens]|uniref:FAD/NAD(P)-binding domain-containing protein n=1 Tax=Viridothelium virens TaxID=1048519 RepID=A0A6A6GXV3_VIRVR|nr:FAD/NAD(P)-binding domain-containing protein [Viridothelium virens]
MTAQDLHVIVIGAGITGLLTCQGLKKAGIRYSLFERDVSMNYRSNEWTMAIHWARPLLKDILPEEIFTKLATIACNPTAGIHSGLYPIINGETGDMITGVPYTDGLRVPRSKMRAMCAEGVDVQYGKKLTDVAFNESGNGVIATFADGTLVSGTMIIGTDGPRSRVRETAMNSADNAAVTKFPIFHTNMTVCYGDAEKAQFVRQKFPTSYLALSQRSFHAFQSISSMPDGPDHPESWIFHMAMAWLGESDNSMSYPERLAMIKERAKGLGEPARSAFLWVPDDTEVHKADISYWVSQTWDNRKGRLTLVGDAAHPMPPYRGQGLNHCICDVSHLLEGLKGLRDGSTSLAEVVRVYEKEMIPRGKEEVSCSVENGLTLHDWNKIQESPVFRRGFKPMDGHSNVKEEIVEPA